MIDPDPTRQDPDEVLDALAGKLIADAASALTERRRWAAKRESERA